ncbi:MAG: hypothetical protein LUC22_02705, partial [Prevotella sp.]|nr:hypothetical protein [Prevotella sp.]
MMKDAKKNILSAGMSLLAAALLLAAPLFVSCIDDDDNDDLSTLRADFAMIQTNASGQTVGFLTDDNEYKAFASPMDIGGAQADTTYRALVYYYDKETYAELYGFTLATVRDPKDISLFGNVKTDPVYLQSVWLSNNNSYINLTLGVMTGTSTSSVESTQTLDIVRSVDTENGNITRLTLYPDPHHTPEYYTQTVYLCI